MYKEHLVTYCYNYGAHFSTPKVCDLLVSNKSNKFSQSRIIVQELCESRGGRLGLSVLTSLLVSVDVKIY